MKRHLGRLFGWRHRSYKFFLVLFIISLGLTTWALRHNNLTMVKLRSAVYAADKAGGDVQTPLNNLRAYVYAHMNTNLASGGNAIKPPIQLQYTYARLVAAEQARVDAINSKIYTQAQIYCQQVNPTDFSGRNRVPCIKDYVASHGGAEPKDIPTALYQFDFVSPAWSPDLAGWSMSLTILLGAAFLISLATHYQKRLSATWQ